MNPILSSKLKAIAKLCDENKVKTLYAFGSICSENFNKDSDVDFLLTFKPEISIEQYTNNYFELHYELANLFNRKIDLITERSLSNPFFIKSVNNSKQLVYES